MCKFYLITVNLIAEELCNFKPKLVVNKDLLDKHVEAILNNIVGTIKAVMGTTKRICELYAEIVAV